MPDTVGTNVELFDDASRVELQKELDALRMGHNAASPAEVDAGVAQAPEVKPTAAPVATPKPDVKPKVEPPKPVAVKPSLELPKPTPPPAKPPVDDEPIPKNAQEWKAFKQRERENAAKEIEALKAQLAKPSTDSETLAKVIRERDAAINNLREVAIERDPEFQKEYEAVRQSLMGMAKSHAAPELHPQLEEIFKMPSGRDRDAAMTKLMSEVPPWKQAQLGADLTQFDNLNMQRDLKIAQARDNFQKKIGEYETYKSQKQAQDRAQDEEVFKRQVAEWQGENGLPLLQKREGDSEWNNVVDETIQMARAIYIGGMPNDQIAKAALMGASGYRLMAEAAASKAYAAELEKELAEYKGMGPGAGGANSTETDTSDELPSDVDYITAIARRARAAGMPG